MSAALQKIQELYSNQNYSDGVELLLETRGDWNPAQFHELLGSFYMKLENYAAARYHFELAIQKGGVTQAVVHNLEYVLQQMGLITSTKESLIERVLEFFSQMPFEFWATISLAFLACAVWRLRSRWFHGSRFLIIMLWLLALLPQGLYWGIYESRVTAIVLAEGPLYEGPSAIFDSAKTVRAGEKVVISKNDEGWAFISSPEVLSGWIESSNLGFIRSR